MSDGEGAQSGANDGTQSGTGETTTEPGTTTETATDGTQSGAIATPAETEAQRAQAEANALRERMKAADQRAAKFEAELKQIRDKDLPEVDKLKRDHADALKQVETLQSTNQQLALQVAFLKDNTYSWHNPESALKLVDLSQVTIEQDGNVSGLKDALKALATSNDYLVKKDASGGTSTTPPGTAPANNGSSAGTRPVKGAALAARLPVMRTRVTPQ